MIGSGNVAHHLLYSFVLNRQFQIYQIFNRRKTARAKHLAQAYNCPLVSQYQHINTTADVYFICVNDDAIADVVTSLSPLHLKGLVVHTSGSVDISALTRASSNIGVYYPLQSFSLNKAVDWKNTPILIEGNTKLVVATLSLLAKSVSTVVKQMSSNKRLELHLAAVFASNFTNALYVAAFQLIEQSFSKKDTKLLMPLMEQSFQKLQDMSPIQAQTGPAKRNDKAVMKKHLALLKTNPSLATIYQLLSELILTQQTKYAKL